MSGSRTVVMVELRSGVVSFRGLVIFDISSFTIDEGSVISSVNMPERFARFPLIMKLLEVIAKQSFSPTKKYASILNI